ncbi:hypothetical protein ACL02R_00950 [Streptomyces sp. MS19]|uniref:hypothetical protein n=1 Tax=Streptomyces sp. MS19 TaxID=3385972 RepID=UPI00399FD8CF
MTFEPGRRSTVSRTATMRICRLAARTGVPATTPRHYETAGLSVWGARVCAEVRAK